MGDEKEMDSLFGINEDLLNDSDYVVEKLNANALPPLLTRYNSEYAKDNLFHLSDENIPDNPRQESAYRGRVGLLIEYAVISILHQMVSEDSQGAATVTFNTTNMFADFFIRDSAMKPAFRIDVKAFQSSSAEASPRYETPRKLIDREKDYVLVARWDWKNIVSQGHKIIVPNIERAVFVSGYQLGAERDKRQILIGGSFSPDGKPLAASGKRDSNFGKMNRLIHSSRVGDPSLNVWVEEVHTIVIGS